MQKGAPQPDISTAEKFKETMLAAKSVAMSNPVGGGTSGGVLMRVFERLGIADTIKPKLTFGAGGPAGLVGHFLVRKEIEIGIQQLSELMAVPGIDIIGPLPEGVQSITVFTGGVLTTAADPAAARALLAYLVTPDGRSGAAHQGHGRLTWQGRSGSSAPPFSSRRWTKRCRSSSATRGARSR